MLASYTHKSRYVESTKQGKIAGACMAWIEATAKNSLEMVLSELQHVHFREKCEYSTKINAHTLVSKRRATV